MKKNLNKGSGIVYSTNPDFKQNEESEDDYTAIVPALQKIKVRLETKHRAGKAVTLLEHFAGTDLEKEALCKKLKSYCGTGGSVKDGLILIQGDNRQKILQWLYQNGFTAAKKI